MKIDAPFGSLWLNADADGLTAVSFHELENHSYDSYTTQAAHELNEYFKGLRKHFTVPLSIHSGTIFQKKVWETLKTIPFGETRTYAQIATMTGSPRAVRAIGQANSKNPLPIIIPCHRVIGKNGHLTGYLGSNSQTGLKIKEALLTIENF